MVKTTTSETAGNSDRTLLSRPPESFTEARAQMDLTQRDPEVPSSLARDEQDVQGVLAWIDHDMMTRPEHLQELDAHLEIQLRELTRGVESDLDAALEAG